MERFKMCPSFTTSVLTAALVVGYSIRVSNHSGHWRFLIWYWISWEWGM